MRHVRAVLIHEPFPRSCQRHFIWKYIEMPALKCLRRALIAVVKWAGRCSPLVSWKMRRGKFWRGWPNWLPNPAVSRDIMTLVSERDLVPCGLAPSLSSWTSGPILVPRKREYSASKSLSWGMAWLHRGVKKRSFSPLVDQSGKRNDSGRRSDMDISAHCIISDAKGPRL
jgi:hypothetical protein